MTSLILKTIVQAVRLQRRWTPLTLLKSARPAIAFHRNFSSALEDLNSSPEETRPMHEGENIYIQNQFRIWPGYKSTVYDISKWNNPDFWKSCRPLLQQLKEATQNITTTPRLMDPSLNEMRKTVLDEISTLTDDELFQLLYGLSLFRQEKTSNPEYKIFWTALDADCCRRMNTWDVETLYIVDDLLYLLSFGRASDFHYNLVKKVCRRMERGKREYYVRSMFVLNISRQIPKFMSTYELEYLLKKLIDDLTPTEVATVCISLFKTESKVQDVVLMEKIVDKVISESKSLHSILISGVAKFLRMTGKIEMSAAIDKFQTAFLPELHRVDLAAALHLGLAGTTSSLFNEPMVTAVKNIFEVNLDKTRLKELERILLLLTMFNIDAESFYQKAANEIQEERRAPEIEFYGKCLPHILYYLSLRGIYIHSLIDKAFHQDFIIKYYGRNMAKYDRELAALDFSVGLNCPDYKGVRLSDKIRRGIAKFHIFYANPVNATRVTGHMGFLRQVVKSSSAILGGDSFIHWCNILPQFYTAELVFCLDANNCPVEIPQEFKDIPDYEVKWIPTGDSKVTYHAIFVCNRGSTEHNTTRLLGQKLEHVKQLIQIGYKVHTIVALDWQACEHHPDMQVKLLMDKVFKGTLNPSLLESVDKMKISQS